MHICNCSSATDMRQPTDTVESENTTKQLRKGLFKERPIVVPAEQTPPIEHMVREREMNLTRSSQYVAIQAFCAPAEKLFLNDQS